MSHPSAASTPAKYNVEEIKKLAQKFSWTGAPPKCFVNFMSLATRWDFSYLIRKKDEFKTTLVLNPSDEAPFDDIYKYIESYTTPEVWAKINTKIALVKQYSSPTPMQPIADDIAKIASVLTTVIASAPAVPPTSSVLPPTKKAKKSASATSSGASLAASVSAASAISAPVVSSAASASAAPASAASASAAPAAKGRGRGKTLSDLTSKPKKVPPASGRGKGAKPKGKVSFAVHPTTKGSSDSESDAAVSSGPVEPSSSGRDLDWF